MRSAGLCSLSTPTNTPCSFSDGVVVGEGTLLVRAACQGEGEPQWMEKVAYVLEGERLSVSDISSLSPDSEPAALMQECKLKQ